MPDLSPGVPATPDAESEERAYVVLRDLIAARVAAASGPLFLADAANLYDAFLAELPPDERRALGCAACRDFVNDYGRLVSIDDRGRATPLLWGSADVPALYRAGLQALDRRVRQAPVAGVLVRGLDTWGRPSNVARSGRTWTHLHGRPPDSLIFRARLQTPEARAAALLEEYKMLQRGLAEFPIEQVRRARAMLRNGQLYRSEKAEGEASWLLELHEAREKAKGEAADRLVWRAVATAPPGYAHVRSTIIGTLLEDLVAGMDAEAIKARWAAKLHPLQYMRPQAAPTAGQIANAERTVEQLGLSAALPRRFARRSDLQLLWQPQELAEQKPAKGGLFSHLRPKAKESAIDGGAVTLTWEKFSRTLLPSAERIELHVPSTPSSFVGMVTAQDPAAPPILQWDHPEHRNPVSLYVYVNGSPAARWGLTAGAWHPVSGVTLSPHLWRGDGSASHHGRGVVFLLEGARDLQYTKGASFFPESLRSELHGVRAVLEAYAKDAVVAGKDEAEGCGIIYSESKAGGDWKAEIRVTAGGVRTTVHLDRWD